MSLLAVSITSPTTEAAIADMNHAAAAGANIVELRLDFIEEPDVARLLSVRPLPVIVTCRPQVEGGRSVLDAGRRARLLGAALSAGAEYVDFELNFINDEIRRVLHQAGKNLIISVHDFDHTPQKLEAIYRLIREARTDVYKLVTMATDATDNIRIWKLLRQAEGKLIAFCMGEYGLMSRILAGKFGSWASYAAVRPDSAAAPGQITVESLKNIYHWDRIDSQTAVYGVIGNPVAHSMSPALHNAAFAAAGLNAVYVPVLVGDGYEPLANFMDAVRNEPWLGFRGFSVTIPHKETMFNYGRRVGAEIDPLAESIGAVNTVVIDESGRMRMYNTDCSAAVEAICNGMGIEPRELAGMPVAVIGAGGAARAVVAGLVKQNARVTIYNRTRHRADLLAEHFAAAGATVQSASLTQLAHCCCQLLVNCTSIGMHPNVNTCPLPRSVLRPGLAVFDVVYNPLQTRLLTEARSAGCTTIDGLSMFINQAAEQFRLWTGRPADREAMKKVVLQQLQHGRPG